MTKKNKFDRFSKIFLVLVIAVSTMLTGCIRPYMTPIYEEIQPNETAFLVPLEGKTSDQGKLDSEQYLRDNQVATKRVEIPQRWLQTGRWERDGKYVPTMRLIKLDRSPVTREWTNSSETGTSTKKQGFISESKESITFSIGMTVTAQIDVDDAAKFLYRYSGVPLASVMDGEVRSRIGGQLIEYHSKLTMDGIRTTKADVISEIRKGITSYFKERGITITNLNYVGDIDYADPQIQTSINKRFIADQDAITQSTKNKMEIDKAEAERKAIEMRQSTLGQQIQLMQIQNQADLIKKWDGKMPSTVVTDGKGNMFLNLGQ